MLQRAYKWAGSVFLLPACICMVTSDLQAHPFDESARATFDFELCTAVKRIYLTGCGDSYHAPVGAELGRLELVVDRPDRILLEEEILGRRLDLEIGDLTCEHAGESEDRKGDPEGVASDEASPQAEQVFDAFARRGRRIIQRSGSWTD